MAGSPVHLFTCSGVRVCGSGVSRHTDRTHGGAHTLLSGPIGTEKWMAPEMLRSGFGGETINEPRKCDVYSCGVVLYDESYGPRPPRPHPHPHPSTLRFELDYYTVEPGQSRTGPVHARTQP